MPTRSTAIYPARVIAALLCLAVTWIHIQDQGGLPGDKTPGYVGAGYYLLEATGVACATLLLLTARKPLAARPIWLLTAGVAASPLLGYLLSRGPGLPDYTDDKGNWTETLGIVSVVVEGTLLLLTLGILLAGLQKIPAAQRTGRHIEYQAD